MHRSILKTIANVRVVSQIVSEFSGFDVCRISIQIGFVKKNHEILPGLREIPDTSNCRKSVYHAESTEMFEKFQEFLLKENEKIF